MQSLTRSSTAHFPALFAVSITNVLRSDYDLQEERPASEILNHPAPYPGSVAAFDTFFMYAMTGPCKTSQQRPDIMKIFTSRTLWLASTTSDPELVSVCLHIALTVDPAATSRIFEVALVGFGPPLHF